ncbi:MAG: SGNH/GDSL hydrolase family protein [Candidatus Omnitrophota bacterium]
MKKYIQNSLIVIVSILFTLSMSELVYRILVYKSFLINPEVTTSHHKTFCEYDPLLGWRHKKNIAVRFVTNEYDALLEFNSKGLRGPEIACEKDSDVYRVLILGDSFAEGYTVNFEDSFPEILREKLAGKIKDKTVEVINAGVGGYSTDQEYLFMAEEGRKFRPDLTVIMFCENDVYYNAQPEYWRGLKPCFALENEALVLKNSPVPGPPVELKQNSIVGFLKRSYLLSHLAGRLRNKVNRELPADQRVRLIKYGPEIENGWLITEKILQKFKLLADSWKGSVLVVYIPPADMVYDKLYEAYINSYDNIDGKIDIRKPAAILRNICSGNEINFLDLTDELRLQGKGRRLYYKWDGHWNKEGHKVVGQVLAEYIRIK